MLHATPSLTGKRPLIVVSNREPYVHFRTPDGRIDASQTTGGVSVALDALMRDRGGIWIAHGAGDADRAVVDARDRVRVPPDSPAYYRLADFCIVSSLHDGMNLIAKEFVAARSDNDGVLVLSEMTGAAHELIDAVIINPYDVDGFVSAIGRAIAMPPDERRPRMRALRRTVAGRDVFLWASDILEGLEQVSRKHVPLRTLPARHDGLARFKHPGFGRVASDAVG